MSSSSSSIPEDDLEWEEWDGKGVFWHHCVAGSFAGVSEHTITYPFDTVKTYVQACSQCPHKYVKNSTTSSSNKLATTNLPRLGMWTTMRHIVSQAGTTAELNATSTSTTAGMTRLWRGVYTIVAGCIPAHALYFSTYEATKHALINEQSGELSPTGAMAAGAAAAVSHDLVMAPLDTVKQRLQLGHYRGMMDALRHMYRFEGYSGLFRSFPITLLTNIPYGMVMVSTNEVMKQRLIEYYQKEKLDISTCLVASSVAGMTAAATTTPLDRIKTFLQTQQLQPTCNQGSCPKLVGDDLVHHPGKALRIIVKNEGIAGLYKGMLPRVMAHTPAVAISWTTYETAKQFLMNQYS